MKIFSVIMLFAFLLPVLVFGQAGSTGMSFLQLGIGARSLGMGEAFTAISGDASSVYYNPASLTWNTNRDILVMHKEWIAGTTTEYLGIAIPGEFLSYGIGVNSTNIRDIEIRLQPGPAQGTFGMHDFSFSGTLSARLDPEWSLGTTIKFLYEKIYTDDATGIAFDLGTRYQVSPEIMFGAAVSNMGSVNSLKTEPITLPLLVRAGGAVALQVADEFNAIVAADIVSAIRDKKSRLHLGTEFTYNDYASLRGGYQFGYDAKSLSAGFGVRYGIIQFDYAFVPFTEGFGSTHTFTVLFRL
jgi:hypothetical protein